MNDTNPERCPLEPGRQEIGKINNTCFSQCEQFWSLALFAQTGVVDLYPSSEDCQHENHDVEFSHESIQRLDDSGRRQYSIVDQCAGCREELLETMYFYECPYSDLREEQSISPIDSPSPTTA